MSMSHWPQQQSPVSPWLSRRFSYWQSRAPGRVHGCPGVGGIGKGQSDPGEEVSPCLIHKIYKLVNDILWSGWNVKILNFALYAVWHEIWDKIYGKFATISSGYFELGLSWYLWQHIWNLIAQYLTHKNTHRGNILWRNWSKGSRGVPSGLFNERLHWVMEMLTNLYS